eukprot:g1204.t1
MYGRRRLGLVAALAGSPTPSRTESAPPRKNAGHVDVVDELQASMGQMNMPKLPQDMLITTEDTWVKSLGYNNDTVDSQYLASLHWAIAQFSGGMDEISPASPLERLFAVAVQTTIFVIALVMLGVFTSGLTQQYIIGGSGARQLATLKRYLKQNNVSKATTKRVCRNAKHAISGDLTPESVELLHVISEPLKVELSFDMYSQVLMWHPFFLELLQENSPLMRPICHRAMSMLLLSSTDIIFNLGEDGSHRFAQKEPSEPKMYIVVSGTLEYTDSYGEVTAVGERRHLAEAVLKHRGTLAAVSDVKLAMLDAQNFHDLCQRFMRRSEAALKILGYATQFIDELNKSLIGRGGAGTKEVQMLTGTKIGIREIPDDPDNRSLNIALLEELRYAKRPVLNTIQQVKQAGTRLDRAMVLETRLGLLENCQVREVEWTISDYSSLLASCPKGQCITSPTFSAAGIPNMQELLRCQLDDLDIFLRNARRMELPSLPSMPKEEREQVPVAPLDSAEILEARFLMFFAWEGRSRWV